MPLVFVTSSVLVLGDEKHDGVIGIHIRKIDGTNLKSGFGIFARARTEPGSGIGVDVGASAIFQTELCYFPHEKNFVWILKGVE